MIKHIPKKSQEAYCSYSLGHCRRRRRNSQIPTWHLSQRTQVSSTSQRALAGRKLRQKSKRDWRPCKLSILIWSRGLSLCKTCWPSTLGSSTTHILWATFQGQDNQSMPMETKLSHICMTDRHLSSMQWGMTLWQYAVN